MRPRAIALNLVAVAAIGLSALNASWIAGPVPGTLVLVAHRGVAQPIDRAAPGAAACSARAIRDAGHKYIENTIFSMHNAVRMGARGLALDVRASADGQAMIFRDAALDCRTDGSGAVADRPLAYLRARDVGYDYTFDGGASFPLRGRGIGGMPIAEEVLRAFGNQQLIFTLYDARGAEALVAAFGRAGVAIGPSHGFAGTPAALARLRQLSPSGWLIDGGASDACLAAYRRTGWTSLVPGPCRGTALDLPRAGEWTLWGWPYRFMGRMAAADARLLIAGDGSTPDALIGLERAEQLSEVPSGYHGLLLIEDMHDVGQALVR